MSSINYPVGTVLSSSFPERIERGHNRAYRLRSFEDLGILIRVKNPPIELAPRFERALEEAPGLLAGGEEGVYVPSVLYGLVYSGRGLRNGKLLIPPGITIDSKFFVPGLAVPDMTVHEVVGPDESPTGYVFRSEYLGPQDLFAPNSEVINDNDATYAGIVKDTQTGKERHPTVTIIASSKSNPNLFRDNKRKLDEIVNSSRRYWWDITLTE